MYNIYAIYKNVEWTNNEELDAIVEWLDSIDTTRDNTSFNEYIEIIDNIAINGSDAFNAYCLKNDLLTENFEDWTEEEKNKLLNEYYE